MHPIGERADVDVIRLLDFIAQISPALYLGVFFDDNHREDSGDFILKGVAGGFERCEMEKI